MENIKKTYQEILEVVLKYEELGKQSEFRDIEEIIDKAKNHLLIIEWQEKYGLNLKHDIQLYEREYIRVGDYMAFSYFSNAKEDKEKGYGKYISWEENGKQPENEWLLSICFSTGAYIFGDDYPVELFSRFWDELKTYEYKFVDNHNHCIYFAIEDSSQIFNDFNSILKKYHEINKDEFKQRKIDKLKKELETLQK